MNRKASLSLKGINIFVHDVHKLIAPCSLMTLSAYIVNICLQQTQCDETVLIAQFRKMHRNFPVTP